MALSAKTAIELTKQYIADVQRCMPIDKVYLYGSYAKGTQREDSDIDVCFFSSAFETKNRLDVLTELFYLKIKYDKDILLEPNAFPTSEIESGNPFVNEIVCTGKEITAEIG